MRIDFFTPTVALDLLHSFFGDVVRPWGYKAPHALRGTPPRPHYARAKRRRRLFKGHRP